MTLALTLATLLASSHGAEPVSARGGGSSESPETLAEERALVARVRDGDAEAFGTLMRRYFSHVVRFVTGFVRDRGEAEDVAQEVFARIWTGRAAWRPSVSVRAYVLGAARHRALNVLRHRSVEARYAVSAVTTSAYQIEADAVHDLEREAELAAMHRVIAELPERRRVALTLRYELGLSHAEVGEALGVSAKAAKELLARTLEALYARLSGMR